MSSTLNLVIPFWDWLGFPQKSAQRTYRALGKSDLIALAYLLFFGTSLVLSTTFTWYLRGLATRRAWIRKVDSPSRHVRADVPRLGGVSLFLAFNLSLAILVAAYYATHRNPEFFLTEVFKFLPATWVIFLLGLADDIWGIKAWIKFGVQIIAALMLYAEGLRSAGLGLFPQGSPGNIAVGLIVTIVWVVVITNAFNLIDGLDGLAAGSALFSTFAVFMVAVIANNRANILLTLGLAACILGFLRFNFNPASIFLGDSGSLTIGFILSAIALRGMKSPTLVAVALPLVACGLPVVDAGIAVIRRFIRGKSIFEADKDHIHHKLLNQGLSQKQAVIALYGVSALLALLSLTFMYEGAGQVALVLVVLGIGGWLGLQQLDYLEFSELKRVAVKTMTGTRAMAANVAVQSAARALGSSNSLSQACDTLRELMEQSDFDGFSLKLANEIKDSAWGHMTEDGISWRRGNWHKGRAHMQIVISLVDLIGSDQGQLTLYREYSGRPLLVDLDLLTGDLQRNLAECISRLKSSSDSVETSAVKAKAAHAPNPA